MNRSFRLFLITIALSALTTGCKKNSSSPAPVVDNTNFTNKVWVGQFNYDAGVVQPMSIEFGGDSSLTWHEMGGDYKGVWHHVDNKLYMSLSAFVSFTADILADTTLTNIVSTDMNKRILKSATLNATENQDLDNTSWVGTGIQVDFLAGTQLNLTIGTTALVHFNGAFYGRQAKTIHFTATTGYNWFMVEHADNTMDGVNVFAPDPTLYGYTLKKQ